MRTGAKIAVSLFAFGAGVLSLSVSSLACAVGYYKARPESAAYADAIFAGTLLSSRKTFHFPDNVRMVFRLHSVLRGDLYGDVIVDWPRISDGPGRERSVGERLLVATVARKKAGEVFNILISMPCSYPHLYPDTPERRREFRSLPTQSVSDYFFGSDD